MNGARERLPSDVVADVAAQAGVEQLPSMRRLTVDLRIEAQSADDSFLSPLVAEALREYLESPAGRGNTTPGMSAMRGKLESRAGLDVTWHATNEYFENGQRVDYSEACGAGGRPARPVPLTVAQLDGEDVIVIYGIRYHREVFKTLANPDPAKRYSFTRQGDTVTVVERP